MTNFPTDAEITGVIKKLEKHEHDTHRDSETMKRWDGLRATLKQTPGGDYPRLIFESIIDAIAEDCTEAARLLRALQKRVKEGEERLRDLADAVLNVQYSSNAICDNEWRTPEGVAIPRWPVPEWGRNMAKLGEAKQRTDAFLDGRNADVAK